MAPHRFPVEPGHLLAFARSIGDERTHFMEPDAIEHGEVVAPLTFTQAGAQFDPDYPGRPGPDRPWIGSTSGPGERDESDSGGGGLDSSVLHAEQRFVYHRHLRPGDVLSVESIDGKTWERTSERSGRLRFSERIHHYRDENGDLVVTATEVAVAVDAGRDPS